MHCGNPEFGEHLWVATYLARKFCIQCTYVHAAGSSPSLNAWIAIQVIFPSRGLCKFTKPRSSSHSQG